MYNITIETEVELEVSGELVTDGYGDADTGKLVVRFADSTVDIWKFLPPDVRSHIRDMALEKFLDIADEEIALARAGRL